MEGRAKAPKFDPGRLVATPGALKVLTQSEILTVLSRHITGDWGDLCKEDREANDKALLDEGRLVSVYHSQRGVKFYVITEWDRSLTTFLLPSEY